MGKALPHDPQVQDARAGKAIGGAVDWRRKVSDHVAYGLLVYTGLHIFWTMTQLKTGGGSVLPYLALFVLVGAIIPACRAIEKRWKRLAQEQDDAALAPQFMREMGWFWTGVIGLPIVLTLVFKGIAALF